jgi:hypothetical protein
MPCRINFSSTSSSSEADSSAVKVTQLTNQTRNKKIKQIIEESIAKYKKTFMRFDFLIFLKNQADANYLIE